MGFRFHSSYIVIAAAFLLGAVPETAKSQTTEERLQRDDAIVSSLINGVRQPTLDRMRQEFPFLAEATQGYAFGDFWSRPGLDNHTRHLAAVAAFAAMGETPSRRFMPAMR